MSTDEIKALGTACAAARQRGWTWRPPYLICLENGQWEVHAENESIIRIDQASGEVIVGVKELDPSLALAYAKEYAIANELRWKPAFSLSLDAEGWDVGCCQSQLGGQTNIFISHEGVVLRHWVNPK